MIPFDIFLIIATILYCGIGVALNIALSKNPNIRVNYEPNVTVIVPARNEETNIERCFRSLTAQNYPAEKLQIIVVDDNSEDKTAPIVQSLSRDFHNCTLLSLSDDSQLGFGKIAALAHGFQHATGEIVFQTDADCVVSEKWIKSVLSIFHNDVGIVGGMTLLEPFSEKSSCFTRIQILDWMYLLGIGAGANALGIPLSCFGNNLALRRKAYDATGGYEAIPFTFTEDFAIFRAVARAGWKTEFTLTESSLVYSRPPHTFRAFINQRLRWAAGGIKLAGKGVVLLMVAFIFHCAVIGAAGLKSNSVILFSSIVAALCVDFLFLRTLAQRVRKLSVLRIFPLFELYYFLYTTFFGITLPFALKLKWKNRSYKSI